MLNTLQGSDENTKNIIYFNIDYFHWAFTLLRALQKIYFGIFMATRSCLIYYVYLTMQ